MAALTFDVLAGSSGTSLERLLRAGVAPDGAALAGSLWRGANVGARMRLLGLRTFMKGFFREDDRSVVEGYNIAVRRDGPSGGWRAKPDADHPKRFGFYIVRPFEPGTRDGRYPNALLLDYGASPRNPRWSPTRLIRDHLVQPDPSDPALLLGKAYLAVGPYRLRSNFFVIERDGPEAWQPPGASAAPPVL